VCEATCDTHTLPCPKREMYIGLCRMLQPVMLQPVTCDRDQYTFFCRMLRAVTHKCIWVSVACPIYISLSVACPIYISLFGDQYWSLSHVTARPVEDGTRNGHRNAKRHSNRNHETIVLGLFSFEILKRDVEW